MSAGSKKFKSKELAEFVCAQFKAIADPLKASEMQAYMKTQMPFYGVQKPARELVYKQIRKEFCPQNIEDYISGVKALWANKHRELKYTAIDYAMSFDRYILPESLALYIELVEDGQWWDFVDPIAIHLIGRAYYKERRKVKSKVESLVKNKNMWLRRSAILVHNAHKDQTDQEQLFRHALLLAHESEFFIRKAIGWALRDYSYVDAKAVIGFLTKHKNELSGLTYREGAKALLRKGLMKP